MSSVQTPQQFSTCATEMRATTERFNGRDVFRYEGKRYDVRGQPFTRLINTLRKNGERPFDTIKIGSTIFAINPITSGKGSQQALIPIDTKLNGLPSKRGERQLNDNQNQWMVLDTGLQRIQVTPDAISETAFVLPTAQTLERRLFEVNIRSMRGVQEYFTESQFITYMQGLRARFNQFKLSYSYGISTHKPNRQDAPQEYFIHELNTIILNDRDINDVILNLYPNLQDKLAELATRGSGQVFVALKSMSVWVSRYEPPRAGSYKPLPAHIANKKACINVKNKDNRCFLYSVLSALHPAEHNADRPEPYHKYMHLYNWDGVSYPAGDKDIDRFERQNDVAINLYGFVGKMPALVRHSDKVSDKVINLLRFEEHYCWIKNFDRFMNCDATSKHHRSFCTRCGVGFYIKEKLIEHQANGCRAQFVSLPSATVEKTQKRFEAFKREHADLDEDELQSLWEEQPDEITNEKSKVKFRAISKMLEHPYVIYADFEAALESSTDTRSQTKTLQKHKAIAYGLQGVCRGDTSLNYFNMKVTEDAGMAFINELVELAPRLKRFLTKDIPYSLSNDEFSQFDTAKRCYLCGGEFGEYGRRKVIDINYTTGTYRGAAHHDCKTPKFVPVLFHNFTGYDSQFILDAVCRAGSLQGWQVDGIAITGEKYKSLSLSFYIDGKPFQYRFIDSLAFLNASLDSLASNLSDTKKHLTRQAFPDDTRFNLMKRKGFLPYDSITSIQSLAANELPAFASLKPVLGKVTHEQYETGLEVWQTFECCNMKDYLLTYLAADVRLLADIVEEFRSMCLREYRLDPVHYVSLPAMAWDALLLKTKVSLDLITDTDMFNMVEAGKRGGVSFIAHRHAKANNKHSKSYSPNERTTWLQYLDANNLYGWAMSQPLPVGGFKWVQKTEVELLQAKPSDTEGYFIECDLEYPADLHIKHHIMPLAPENAVITPAEHSPYQQSYAVTSNSEKLITSLRDKTKYVLHVRNFQQYISLGMKCKKIHRVLQFNQAAWMKPFIDFNTDKRKQAKDDFEKDLYKLMNNSVFGKTMENVRDRIEPKILMKSDEKRLKKNIQKPNYSGMFQQVGDANILIMKKVKITLDKPIAVGTAILDLSKTLMYDFHYNVMLPKYGVDRLRLCMTDTDSLLYWIATDDIYSDMRELHQHFDASEYPTTHPNYSATNKKVLGKFKDEEAQDVITEFVGLRAKLYAYETAGMKQKKRAKSVKKDVVKTIPVAAYLNILNAGATARLEDMHRSMRTIRSIDHQLRTIEQTKVALCAYDDKRWLMDSAFSVPHGFNGDQDEIRRLQNLWRC